MRPSVPWVGLAALAAMFALPWAQSRGWLDGPRTIRHRTRRHVCGDCGAPWTPSHACADFAWEPVVHLRGDLRRPALELTDREADMAATLAHPDPPNGRPF